MTNISKKKSLDDYTKFIEMANITISSAENIPDFSALGKVSVIWDKNLSRKNNKVITQEIKGVMYKVEIFNSIKCESGCYLWYENHHLQNNLLYIGSSSQLLTRIYNEEAIQSGFLYQYIENKLDQKFEPCSNYDILCDCLPRYFAVLIETADYIEIEKKLIKRFEPPLNKLIYKVRDHYEGIFSVEVA